MNTSRVHGSPAASTGFNTSILQQSNIVLESGQHRLASYGSNLPVVIFEAICTEDTQPVRLQCIKISDNGWSWLVLGRRLFVWQFKTDKKKTASFNPGFELELPPSDLSFKADLVTLFVPEEGDEGSKSSPVSLLAVSPEGTVRFWLNIAFESSFIETTVQDLQGQECSTLCHLGPNACLLATTTSSLVYVSIHQNELSFRTLRSPQGMLSGFKKFTSFFGMSSVVPVQEPSVKSFIGLYRETSSDTEGFIVYALTGSTLQIWSIESTREALLGEQDLEGVLKNSFFHLLPASTDPSSTKILIVDAVLPKRRRLEVLVTLVSDANESGFLSIAVASFVCRGADITSSSFSLDSFTPINDPSNLLHKERSPSSLRFLSCPGRNTLYVYDDAKLFFIRSGSIVDSIDFEARDDEILGTGVCDSTPLLFTSVEGLVTIIPTVIDMPDMSSSQHNLSLSRSTDMTEGRVGWFRKAFYLYSRNEKREAENLLKTHFNITSSTSLIDLASVVSDFAYQVVDGDLNDDLRPEDWSSQRSFTGSSHDILTSRSIEEKRTTISILLDFVDSVPGLVEVVSHLMPLGLYLQDLIDRLTISLNVKSCYRDFSHVLDPILKIVQEKRTSSLSHSFIEDYYREPSKSPDIMAAIIQFEENSSRSVQLDADEVLQLQITISDLILFIFGSVISRKNRFLDWQTRFPGKLDNYVPWDASSTPKGLRECLSSQIELLQECSLRMASTSDTNRQNKEVLFDRYTQLSNLLLESYWYQLKLIQPNSQYFIPLKTVYEETRSRVLKVLLTNELFEKATLLAEKYEDFDTLIEICERTGAEEQLERYRSMFASKGFSSHLTNWYLKHSKPAKALKMPSSSGSNQILKEHSHLLWIQQIQGNDIAAGCQTLKTLADQETANLSRKKTILSLCKLAALVSDQTSVIAEVDQQLYDIHNHEMQEVMEGQE